MQQWWRNFQISPPEDLPCIHLQALVVVTGTIIGTRVTRVLKGRTWAIIGQTNLQIGIENLKRKTKVISQQKEEIIITTGGLVEVGREVTMVIGRTNLAPGPMIKKGGSIGSPGTPIPEEVINPPPRDRTTDQEIGKVNQGTDPLVLIKLDPDPGTKIIEQDLLIDLASEEIKVGILPV